MQSLAPRIRALLALLGVVALAFGAGWLLRARAETKRQEAFRGDLVAAVRDILKISVTEIRLSQIYEIKKEGLRIMEVPIPLTGQQSLVVVQGKVLAGYDLEGVAVAAGADRSLRVTLPAPSLVAVDLDYRFMHEKDVFFNRISPQDRNETLASIRRQVEAELAGSLARYPIEARTRQWIDLMAKSIGATVHVESKE